MQPAHSRWKFIADRRTPVYRTLAAELDAIARGHKRLSFFATDREGLADDLAVIRPAADKRGLVVTVAPRGRTTPRRTSPDIDLFVHRVETDPARRARQERDLAALTALLSRAPWTFESEASLGALLGYAPAQRAAWLAAERHARPGFGVVTLHAEILGAQPFPLEWWTEPGRVLAPDAYKVMARGVPGLHLWRVGMDPPFAKYLDTSGRVDLADAPKKVRAAFDKAMRTPLELLGPKGWHRPARRWARR